MELIVPFKQLSKQLKQPLPFKLLIFLRELFFFQVQNSIHFLLPGNFNLNLLFQEDYYDSLRLKVLLVLEFLETFSLAYLSSILFLIEHQAPSCLYSLKSAYHFFLSQSHAS